MNQFGGRNGIRMHRGARCWTAGLLSILLIIQSFQLQVFAIDGDDTASANEAVVSAATQNADEDFTEDIGTEDENVSADVDDLSGDEEDQNLTDENLQYSDQQDNDTQDDENLDEEEIEIDPQSFSMKSMKLNVAETLAEKKIEDDVSKPVDVTDYYDGDAFYNDAFGDALAVVNNRTENRVLYVPGGTYNIKRGGIHIENCSDITIVMAEDAILQAVEKNGEHYQVFFIQNAEHIKISGGKILGDRYPYRESLYVAPGSGTEDGMGIRANGVTDLVIEDMTIEACRCDGITLDPTILWGGQTPVGVQYCNNVTIRNCIIQNNRRDNISITGAEYVSISDSKLLNAGGDHGLPNQCGLLIEPYVINGSYKPCSYITIENTDIKSLARPTVGNDGTRQNLAFATYLIDSGTYSKVSKASGWIGYSSEWITLKNCNIYGDLADYSGNQVRIVDSEVNGIIEYANTGFLEVSNTPNYGIQKGLDSFYYYKEHNKVSFWDGPKQVATSVVQKGNAVSMPAIAKKDGNMLDWYLGNTKYNFDQAVNTDITLTATWTEQTTPVTYYLVTFDANGGTVEPESVQVENGSYVTAPTPSNDGHVFKGWYLGDDEFDAIHTPITGNIKLTAKWEESQVIPPQQIYTDVLYEEALKKLKNGAADVSWSRVLCIGDSLTYGQQSPEGRVEDDTYPAEMQKVLSDVEVLSVDKGAAAVNVNDPNRTIMGAVDELYQQYGSNIDAVFLMAGTVDYMGYNDRELGDISKKDTFAYDLYQVCEKLITYYEDADIFIILPPTIEVDGRAVSMTEFQKTISEVAAVCSLMYGTQFIDLAWQGMFDATDDATREKYYSADGIHLNGEGYRKLGTILAGYGAEMASDADYITVSFDTSSADNEVEIPAQKVRPGRKVKEPQVTLKKAGYEFKGWLVNGNAGAIFDFNSPLARQEEDVILYPWFEKEKDKYTVSFYNDDQLIAAVSVVDGEKISTDDAPTSKLGKRENDQFLGWSYTRADKIFYQFENEEYGVSHSFDLFAVWESDFRVTEVFTVTLIDENQTTIMEIEDGQTVTEPDEPQKEGYRFLGWFAEGATVPYDFRTPVTGDLTLTARFEIRKPLTYEVVFDTDGGSAVTSQTIMSGMKVTKPSPDPVKNGYDFVAWQLDGTAYDFDTPVTENITLKAVWEAAAIQPTTYIVEFDTDGGNTITAQEVEENGTAKQPEKPTKEGYNFKEWQLNGTAYDFDTPVTGDITLKAIWERIIPDYTVSFNSDGGSAVTSQIVKENGTAKQPEKPTKEGYNFKEWQLNGTAYDFDTPVTGNITLKAIWERIIPDYTVSFNSDGGSAVTSQTVKENGTATQPVAPTREGYTFKEWRLNGTAYDFDTPVTGDITLTAVWERNKYIVSFDTSGGSSVAPQEIIENDKVTRPENPSKAGHDFVEWQLNGKTYDFNTPVTENITLKAIWEAEGTPPTTYIVKFDTDGGNTITAQEVEENGTATQPEKPTKEGYNFKEWQLNGTAYDFDTPVTGDITLKAIWERIIPDYTVSFNSDGGSAVTSQIVKENETATQPEKPIKEGYNFVEWQLNGTTYNFDSPVTGDITLTAVWERNKYTVSFNADGGSEVTSQKVEENGTATQPAAPTRKGYTFKEWQLNGKTYDFSTPVTEDITLTAAWERNKYTVSFNANGGSDVTSQMVEEDGTATPPVAPTMDGYSFVEWQLNGEKYDFTTPVTKNITLTAVWSKNPVYYTVTYMTDATVIGTGAVLEGDKAQKPVTDPSKAGYTFRGWYLQGASEAYDFDSAVNSDITLVAQFELIPVYHVTFLVDGVAKSIEDIREGQVVQEPAAPEKDNYKFLGWYLNGNAYDFTTPVTQNMELTAQFKELYEVKIDGDGDGTEDSVLDEKKSEGDEIVIPAISISTIIQMAGRGKIIVNVDVRDTTGKLHETLPYKEREPIRFTMPGYGVIVKPVYKTAYRFLDSDGLPVRLDEKRTAILGVSFTEGSIATFRIGSVFEKFAKLLIDGKEITKGFTLRDGSTIIDLDLEELQLAPGEHTIQAVFDERDEDGNRQEPIATFNVTAKASSGNGGSTGGTGNTGTGSTGGGNTAGTGTGLVNWTWNPGTAGYVTQGAGNMAPVYAYTADAGAANADAAATVTVGGGEDEAIVLGLRRADNTTVQAAQEAAAQLGARNAQTGEGHELLRYIVTMLAFLAAAVWLMRSAYMEEVKAVRARRRRRKH